MNMRAIDPSELLDVLTGASSAAIELPSEHVERARALLSMGDAAKAEDVEALPEPLAQVVLEASVRRKSAALADQLAGSKHKALAKAAKKALYQLRSSGVVVPEKKPVVETAPTVVAAVPEEVPPSLVSGITGTGERALIIGRPVRARVETVQIVIADESGVVHLGLNDLSRGQYRKLLKDAHRPGAPASVEIPLAEARELLAEAVGTNLTTHTPFPDGLDHVLRHLEVKPWEHPAQVPPPEEDDQATVMRGAELHQQPEISQWLPPVEDLRKFALKAQEIATSKLYVDEDQRAKQLRHVVETTSEEFLTPAIRQVYGRRLWRMAEFFDRTHRPEPAAIARAEARRMFHSAPGVLSPFVVRMFEKVLALQ